ncbi:MAG: hypothetical protein LBU88_01865 [Treponema sp.]|nr:hypothetical protein [Treponema sp.]
MFIIYCKPRQTGQEETLQKTYIDYIAQGGALELPITGASGYAAMDLPLHQSPEEDSFNIAIIKAGRGFTILKEDGDFWYIDAAGINGWIKHHFCMINIADVIPSIVHNNTNTYSSLFKTSGYDIPNITGKALYNMRDYNVRLNREEFIAPVLYGMIKRIHKAQQAALLDGNTLVIYEAFRPAAPHNELFEALSIMAEENPIVKEGISSGTFRSDLFLAPSPYNHQRGTAIDVSLAKIINLEKRITGDYIYTHITEYAEYPMQTPIHELSVASAVYKRWVNARTFTGWMSGEFSDSATDAAKLLQKYFTDAGLIPLASEWWHFNDLNWSPPLIDVGMTGEFFIEKTYSKPPFLAE